MKKIFLLGICILPISAYSNSTIDKKSENGEYTTRISYDDNSRLNKTFHLSKDFKMFLISKNNDAREFFQCYNNFSVVVNDTPIRLNTLELDSNGSRIYVEDVSDNDETINKIKSKPKSFYESFSFELSKKNISEIKKSERIVIKICDKEETLSEEEIAVIKETINDYEVNK